MAKSVPEVGMCIATEYYDAATNVRRVRIDCADEFIEITGEFLDQLTDVGWAGEGLFRLEAENGQVTYQLLEERRFDRIWLAKRLTPWPPAGSAGSPPEGDLST